MVSNKIRKVLFFFDSRATFAYSNNVVEIFKKKKKKFFTVVSGNYLDKEFGIRKNFFSKHKIKINKKVKFESPKNSIDSWSKSMGSAIIGYAEAIKKLKPDIIVLTGDRIETLSFCIAASYMNCKIAHIQAGDKSGHIDDLARAAIAKFSHLHFAPSLQAIRRLKSWGEDKKRIFFTGAPQLNDMKRILKSKKKEEEYYVVIFHPILNETSKLSNQIKILLKFLRKLNKKIYWIYSNNDYGYEKIIKNLVKIKINKIEIIKNLDREKFLELIRSSQGVIGNSSCGIIEASMFHLPVINIGKRQHGRPQTKNIVNTKCKYNELIKAYKKIKSMNRNFLKKIKNPYFKSNSSKMIYNIIFRYPKKHSIFVKY